MDSEFLGGGSLSSNSRIISTLGAGPADVSVGSLVAPASGGLVNKTQNENQSVIPTCTGLSVVQGEIVHLLQVKPNPISSQILALW